MRFSYPALAVLLTALCPAGLHAQDQSPTVAMPSITAESAEAKANDANGQIGVVPHMVPPAADEPHQDLFGAHIQRSMTLLETSNKEKHWPVRILLYGQSIIGSSSMTTYLQTYFAQRYPNADITFENRAIGGFSAERLVGTATHDLYPFYPDLLIFHDYGGQKTGEIERMISNVRRYTTSDIVLFDDHRTNGSEIADSSTKFWKELAAKYDCELVDVSTEWMRYLREHNLQPRQLLRDNTHPSIDGYVILAQMIERHLLFNPIFSDPWDSKVRLYEARRPLAEGVDDEITLTGTGWTQTESGIVASTRNNKLHLEFEGNRIDLIAAHTKLSGGTAKILLDGKPPSQFLTTSAITLPSPGPGTWFPTIKRVLHTAPLLPEDWTLRITRINADATDVDFTVTGSRTGPDGSGNNKQIFHSKSGRVVLEPEDWQLAGIVKGFKEKYPPPVGYEVHWKSVPMYTDTYTAPATPDDAKVYETTLAQGMPNTRHTLDILLNGDGSVPIEALQVYRPPLR